VDVTWASEYQIIKNGDIILYNNNYPGQVFYRPRPGGIAFEAYVDVNNANKMVIYSNTVTANFASSLGKITSITNYSTQRSNNALDFDTIDCECFAVYGTDRSYQVSQELRDVFHPARNVEVLIGGFWQTWGDFSDGLSLPFFASRQIVSRGQTKMRQDTFAGFTQVYWDVTDRLRIQGGFRLSWENVWLYRANLTYFRPQGTTSREGRNNLLNTILLPLPVGNEPNAAEHDWTNWGGKVGADYRLNDDIMVYGYVARGFKTGGFNGRVSDKTTIGPFNPEFVNTFELGFKSDLLNNTLRINAAVFLNKWKEMQVPYTVFATGGTSLSSIILNAGRATTKGAEAEVQWAPVRGLRFDATVGYLDAVYDEFLSGQGDPCPPPTQAQPVGCATDFSGRPLAYAPKWNYSLTASYSFAAVGGQVTAMGQYAHNDKKWGSHTQSTNERLAATDLVNANLSWDAEDRKWGVALWARNLTNEHYIASALDVPPLFVEAVLGPPREFGLDLKFNF
jgi:iron complex outermembrane receptor protein